MTSDRLPPHDIAAEEAVIASLMLGASMNGTTLTPADFYHEPTRLLYKACCSLQDRSATIDQAALANEAQQQGSLELVGGAAYLSRLIAQVPTSMDLLHYAEIVRRFAVYRRLIDVGDNIMQLGFEAGPDLGQALDKADDLILGVRRDVAPKRIVTPEDRYEILSERYDRLYQSQGVAIRTGFHDLDRRLGGGMFGGEMIMLAARPSVGKTTWLQTIANHVGQNAPVLFCSGEMSVEGVSDRDVAGIVGVGTGVIRYGHYDHDVYAKIVRDALPVIKGRQVYFYQDVPMTTAKILEACLAMQLRYGLRLVVVDYLGTLDDEAGRSQYERISCISRKLKQAARVLDVPLLVAHQLNRTSETRTDKRPQLHDLRDSGRLEEDADVVLFLYRESYYDDTAGNVTEVLLAKVRQGEGGKRVKLLFDPQAHCYQSLEERMP